MANFLKSLFVKGVEIDTASATAGKVLTYDGTKFAPATPGSGSLALDDLSDAVITTPTATQLLKYNGTNWVNSENFTGYDYEIHVSQVDGNDTTGNGDLLTPVASITKALTLVTSQRKTVIIHPGTYTESPSITTQYTTITGPGLIGGNIVISGTLSTNTGCTVSGIKMTNLTVSTPTGQGNVNILNCEVSGTFTKSSNADYTVARLCDFGAVSITGAGLVAIFGGNPNFVTVNNASANVIIKSAVTVAPVLTAGTLSLVDSIVAAAVTNAVTSAASSTITLANCQFLTSALTGVAPVVLNGFYSILNCVYDKPSSTLVASSGTGGTTNSIDYFQYINADKFITQGGTSSQFVKGNGSLASTIDLGTDTTGNYMSGISGTSPVTVSFTPGGGASASVSLAANYGDTQNPYASKTANYVLAAPNGTAGVPTFRAIVAADIPTLNQNTTGTAATVTGAAQTAITSVGTLTSLTVGGAGANRSITINAPSSYYAIQYFQINGVSKWHYEAAPDGLSLAIVQSGVAARLTVTASGTTISGTATATTFAGSGASLTSIPNSATTATSANTSSAIVARDASGNFTAGTITAALTGTASGNLVSGGALGTPSSGTLTNCTSIPAGNLTGTVASARIAGAYTGITQLGTISGQLTAGTFVTNNASPSLELGDWASSSTWSAVDGYNGYLLMGNTSDRACYLRTWTNTPVYIGANQANTLQVGSNYLVVNGSTVNDTLNVIGGSAWFSAMPASTGSTVVNTFGFLRYVSSRRELKENIVDVELSDGLDRVLALRPVEFTFKPELLVDANELTPFDVKRGFIAQETAEVDHRYGQWGWVDENQMMATTPAINGELPLEDATPIYWNHDAVIADLVASIQNINARLQQLEVV